MLNKSGVICLDHLVHQIPGISVNTRNTAAYTNDDASIRQNRQNNGFFFFFRTAPSVNNYHPTLLIHEYHIRYDLSYSSIR